MLRTPAQHKKQWTSLTYKRQSQAPQAHASPQVNGPDGASIKQQGGGDTRQEHETTADFVDLLHFKPSLQSRADTNGEHTGPHTAQPHGEAHMTALPHYLSQVWSCVLPAPPLPPPPHLLPLTLGRLNSPLRMFFSKYLAITMDASHTVVPRFSEDGSWARRRVTLQGR